MKQELTIPEQESNIDIKIGDMFRWTEKSENNNEKFIYLGDKGSIKIPLNASEHNYVKGWAFTISYLGNLISQGEIERLPKGTTFTITQE